MSTRKTFLMFLAALALAGGALAENAPVSAVPIADQRSAEQTLLTVPEWFLVHSPAEYARTIAAKPSHDFPFLTHIGQLWSAYWDVTQEQIAGSYPANLGYHVMIGVLSVSTTVEYSLRSAYENTVGRVGWVFGGSQETDEEHYAAVNAQAYVDFIRQEPWYLFDFKARLVGLWSDVPMWGPGLVRKWERRYALTSEYAVKMAYGKLIEFATRSAYTPALMTTNVVADQIPAGWAPPGNVKVLGDLGGGRELLAMPRYFDFRIAATQLAEQGVHLVDIAGNRGQILVTVWAAQGRAIAPELGRVLFTQAIQNPANTQRVALLMPVGMLSGFLAAASKNGLVVEHVHDY